MSELDIETALAWRGRTVVDRSGEKIGTLKDLYLDEDERPRWGSVKTGLFGLRETLVPLDSAAPEDDALRLPFDREHVYAAPNVDPDVQLTPDEEAVLYDHYRVEAGEAAEPDDAMTRSEEVVRFGKRTRPRGRARLKKYVVTDYVEKKVPVKREEVRLEYEPADEHGERSDDPHR
jgi:uncharacterized protein DUF2382/PRC-barrel domain protein